MSRDWDLENAQDARTQSRLLASTQAELGAITAIANLPDAEFDSLGPINGTVDSKQYLAVDARLWMRVGVGVRAKATVTLLYFARQVGQILWLGFSAEA